MAKQKILIADDEAQIREILRIYFEKEGFEVIEAEDGAAAILKVQSEKPDILLLDIMMPVLDGIEVCKQVRKMSDLPIIMVTAKDDDDDRIAGLEIGADDYLPKPFDPRELLVRIKVVLRRAQSFPERARVDEAPFVRFDQWRLDTRARQVLSAEGLVISLGNSDYRVLRLLLQHPNRPLSRDFLLNHVFDKDSTPFDRSIDVCVSRLRQQLAPGLIKTVRNEGYMLTSACVTSES